MIQGLHAMFYTSEAEALRAFFRDKLGFPHIDAGEGWLIFRFTDAELGCHPLDESGKPPSGTADISFFCDDIESTVRELTDKGVTFEGSIQDMGYARAIRFKAPGDFTVQLYQPSYER
jgi:catechol 2,3-dioxygenase-like lactoylglutathione lyase family enzyme